MTKYHIKKLSTGYGVQITTETKTHHINITDELLDLRLIYFANHVREKERLSSAWRGGERLKSTEITKDDNVLLSVRDTHVLCDLALSQAIVQMLDTTKGVKHNGL